MAISVIHKRTPSFGIILSLFTAIFFVGVVPGFINIAFGQEEREVRFLFNSENVGDEFDIYVQLPEGFEGKR